MKNLALVVAGIAGLSAVAQAQLVHVRVQGVVDYSVIQGSLAGTQPGTPVVMEFDVDTNQFLNSATFPTRGYRMIESSFSMLIGVKPVEIVSPQPQTPWFVIRDNDPAVDGFFISRQGVELPVNWQVRIPGLTPLHELDFSRGFNVSTIWNSLNILNILGTYGFENMSSYQWTIGRFGNPGLEVAYQSIQLSLVNQNIDLTGTLLLSDTGTFAANRTIGYDLIQGTTSLASGSVVAGASNTGFTIPVSGSATGAATLVFDGSSFLRRSVAVNLTGSAISAGTITCQNGDVDNSGEVDAADIDAVIAAFGSTAVLDTDVDVSGEVDAADIDIVIANFGGVND